MALKQFFISTCSPQKKKKKKKIWETYYTEDIKFNKLIKMGWLETVYYIHLHTHIQIISNINFCILWKKEAIKLSPAMCLCAYEYLWFCRSPRCIFLTLGRFGWSDLSCQKWLEPLLVFRCYFIVRMRVINAIADDDTWIGLEYVKSKFLLICWPYLYAPASEHIT